MEHRILLLSFILSSVLVFLAKLTWYNSILLLLFILSTIFVYIWIVQVALLRSRYESQGIPFLKGAKFIFGTEDEVDRLWNENLTHDSQYISSCTDFVATIRGPSIQLYATTIEAANQIMDRKHVGPHIDRDSPCVYSFGRLSPIGLSFISCNAPFFTERRQSIVHGLMKVTNSYHVSRRVALRHLAKNRLYDGSGELVNMRPIVTKMTEEAMGIYVWGERAIQELVDYKEKDGSIIQLNAIDAMNRTFNRLIAHAYRTENRIWFPLAALPITTECRYLDFNIAQVREGCAKILRDMIQKIVVEDDQEIDLDSCVAHRMVKDLIPINCPFDIVLEDVIDITFAGFGSIRSTTLSSLYQLLRPENQNWRDDVVQEMEPYLKDEDLPDLYSHWKTTNLNTFDEDSLSSPSIPPLLHLKSCVTEAMRLDPPGSLMNNVATQDFVVNVGQKQYTIYKGTRILPSVHTIHRSSLYWHSDNDKREKCDGWEYKPQRFINEREGNVSREREKIDPFSHFFPFGKSDRQCPGAVAGLLMARTFVATILWYNRKGSMKVDETLLDSKVHFNLQSSAGYSIQCSSS